MFKSSMGIGEDKSTVDKKKYHIRFTIEKKMKR